MFGTILIANRGEIACRIIRTARRMGVRTVAVHSDADAGALHVSLADEAVRIGPAPAAESYLRVEAIVAACRATGAEAVHPGYGFLSENAALPRALAAAGVAWIGPNPDAIAAMGDKIESKRRAAAAGVTTVPGHLGVVEGPEHAVAVADAIGYPVMIKASAGGGGKGMRVARSADEVAEGFARSASEAASSFGDDRVFIERFIVEPRHVEIQVIGDKHGTVIHLGERECSIQRRNQKVVEEAPSPLLDEATRAAMGAQAVALARAVGYDSAGTVEFVAGQDRGFYFLEMNTRLQVEHPVTELVTGLDLVELMIRSAAGEPLGLRQEDVALRGHAVECRVYAEDPGRGFLPSVGRLTTYRPPAEGAVGGVTTRNDTGVFEGGEVSIHYDPMIAKLVTHAPTREGAINAQALALDAFAIEGVGHNLPFLAAVMARPRWREGRLSTGFIEEEFGERYRPPAPEGEEAARFALAAAQVDDVLERRRAAVGGRMRPAPAAAETERVVRLGEGEHRLAVRREGDALLASVDAGPARRVASAWRPGEPVWRGTVDGAPLVLQVRAVPGGHRLSRGGREALARVMSPRAAALAARLPARAAGAGARALLSPMPGLVRAVSVGPGQRFAAGDALIVVEAMKMENVLRAEADGTVKALRAAPGDAVAVDQVLIEFA